MMIAYQVDLQPYNSFGISITAAAFGRFANIGDLEAILTAKNASPFLKNVLILGGGSNMLFTKPFDGLVLKNEIKGIELIDEDDDDYYVRAGGGENWHQFVLHCIGNNWTGVENLSLIPGSVGAAPIQNIGAYGVELKDVVHSLQAFHLQEHCLHTFTASECAFDYRDSVFKQQYARQFAIVTVTFKLPKKAKLHTSYGAIAAELERMQIMNPDIAAVSRAVIRIRQSKLPDPATIGNAGSFFKNPLVPQQQLLELQQQYANLPHYPAANGYNKIPAAWLIEKAGWKGFRKNDAGVFAQQPLVLVNYGHASGSEIFYLSQQIIDDVFQRFGIQLEREVNVY